MTKLLIVTQVVDEADPVLGFFTRWIEAFAGRSESVEAICLREGKHTLPQNVSVHALGKRADPPINDTIYSIIYRRVVRTWKFLALAWALRRRYDAVFVHMNQEYLLVAGWLWFLTGKRAYLWRNTAEGSWLTHVAVFFCRRVFTATTTSYIARFRKARLMPVGVDLARFQGIPGIRRVPGSVLMAGRIAPSKRVRNVTDALANLALRGVHLPLTLIGVTNRGEEAYRDGVIAVSASAGVGLSLRGGMPHQELARAYQEHDIVVNVSMDGMFDKTMIEALASGCLVLTSHTDLAKDLDSRLSTTRAPSDIADHLAALVALPDADKETLRAEGRRIARMHALPVLMDRLAKEMCL